jgi:4-diphosphocytidyl-2-C-methyl-D-erythritol kinase
LSRAIGHVAQRAEHDSPRAPAAKLVVAAPAKVNLFLHVTGRRADGYHTLESLFALIDLADVITLERREDGVLRRTRELAGVPEAQDLGLRAARALQAASGTSFGVDLAVQKNIPQGGGLGGGSSDAASVLLALNRLWDLAWPRRALQTLAGTLGADVPFFVGGENALARGIGEQLTPVSLPSRWIALAIPDVVVPTATIFAAPELTRSSPSAKMDVFSEGYGRNDLAPAAASRFPAVAATIAALSRASSDARMTGSGACVFAAFSTEEEARGALKFLPTQTIGRVARTLARHPLAGFG